MTPIDGRVHQTVTFEEVVHGVLEGFQQPSSENLVCSLCPKGEIFLKKPPLQSLDTHPITAWWQLKTLLCTLPNGMNHTILSALGTPQRFFEMWELFLPHPVYTAQLKINAVDLYSGGSMFVSRTEHPQPWVRHFLFFPITIGKCRVTTSIFQSRLLPNPVQFTSRLNNHFTDVSEERVASTFWVEARVISSTLKMEAIHSPERSVNNKLSRRHIPEHGILYSHLHGNPKSCIHFTVQCYTTGIPTITK
jgi:hypothetical protein